MIPKSLKNTLNRANGTQTARSQRADSGLNSTSLAFHFVVLTRGNCRGRTRIDMAAVLPSSISERDMLKRQGLQLP
jgi:hypothetical protein